MRVIEVAEFGGPEVLVATEAPEPVAGEGDVVVSVSVAPVLFLDTQLRRGWGHEYFGVQPPWVPGFGVAGEVVSVGAGVEPTLLGRRVVADTRGGGGYAERAVAPANRAFPVPGGLALEDAAALLQDGRTALGLAERARLRPGQWVLVLGAGGGMGSLLVQRGRGAGARVVGAAGDKRRLDLAAELGAEVVVDYTDPGWAMAAREATGGQGFDVVFDGVGGAVGAEAFEVTADGGWFSAHGAPSGQFSEIDPTEARRRGITVQRIGDVQYSPADARRLTETAMADAATRGIVPTVGQTFPLARAADAHRAIEARDVVGKTLLIIGPQPDGG